MTVRDTMQIFVSIRKTLAVIGVVPHQSPLNGIVLLYFGTFALLISSHTMNLFKNVRNFKQYAESIYLISCAAMIALEYTVMVVQVLKISELMDRSEKTVNERE